MSSSSSNTNIESLLTTSRRPLMSHKWKVVLSAVLTLGAVATIGACAAAAVLAGTHGDSDGARERRIDSTSKRFIQDTNEPTEDNELYRDRRVPSHAEEVSFRPPSSCYSEELNNSIPAAHIKGKGREWKRNGSVYDQRWDCIGSLAFVSGGMWFEQESNSIYVPKCGFYHVASDIAFQNKDQEVHSHSYTLKIDRNCGFSRDTYYRRGNTVNAPTTVGTLKSITSIHINDIVKICQGGRIQVTIPTETNDCCPRGYSETTSLSAYLVSESDCTWPLPSHKEPKETYQTTP